MTEEKEVVEQSSSSEGESEEGEKKLKRTKKAIASLSMTKKKRSVKVSAGKKKKQVTAGKKKKKKYVQKITTCPYHAAKAYIKSLKLVKELIDLTKEDEEEVNSLIKYYERLIQAIDALVDKKREAGKEKKTKKIIKEKEEEEEEEEEEVDVGATEEEDKGRIAKILASVKETGQREQPELMIEDAPTGEQ